MVITATKVAIRAMGGCAVSMGLGLLGPQLACGQFRLPTGRNSQLARESEPADVFSGGSFLGSFTRLGGPSILSDLLLG